MLSIISLSFSTLPTRVISSPTTFIGAVAILGLTRPTHARVEVSGVHSHSLWMGLGAENIKCMVFGLEDMLYICCRELELGREMEVVHISCILHFSLPFYIRTLCIIHTYLFFVSTRRASAICVAPCGDSWYVSSLSFPYSTRTEYS